MEKPYRVLVFGKAGCDKCKMLNKRLDALLAKPEWQDFEKLYCDLETEDGLVPFCQAECVNPSRVPAIVVKRQDEQTGKYLKLRNPQPGSQDSVCKKSKLYTYLGLQTDYSGSGKGLITPDMLTHLLSEARCA